MPVEAVRVRGLREVQRDLKLYDAKLGKELRAGLRALAEPVRARAESLATSEIRNIGPDWGRMRVGVTSKVVYVAPRSRRRSGSPRKNLAGLLMGRAMQPALDELAPEIVSGVEALLDTFGSETGF